MEKGLCSRGVQLCWWEGNNREGTAQLPADPQVPVLLQGAAATLPALHGNSVLLRRLIKKKNKPKLSPFVLYYVEF